MTSRARLTLAALALALLGLALLARWLAAPSPSASWPDEGAASSDAGDGAAPSLGELEAETRGPRGHVAQPGGQHAGSGQEDGRAPAPAGAPAPPESAGASAPRRAGAPDAGAHATTRLEALLHAAGLVDDERKDPQLSAFEQLRELPAGAPFEAITREGRVVTARGEAPVPVGARCQLRVLPARKDAFDCAVLAVCGGVIVYPDPRAAGGLNTCLFEADGAPRGAVDAAATDDDGDPTLRLDLAEGSVAIGDTVPAFDLGITLEGAPSRAAAEAR